MKQIDEVELGNLTDVTEFVDPSKYKDCQCEKLHAENERLRERLKGFEEWLVVMKQLVGKAVTVDEITEKIKELKDVSNV